MKPVRKITNNHEEITIGGVDDNEEEAETEEQWEEEIETEAEEEEETSEEESDGLTTLDALDQNDPVQGPAYMFLDEIIKNALVSVNTTEIRLSLSVVLEEDEEVSEATEELVAIRVTPDQRFAIFQANITQLLSLLKSHNIDFITINKLRDEYGNKKGVLDLNDETVIDALNECDIEYLDYIQRIFACTKKMFKENEVATIEALSPIMKWAISRNDGLLYDDLSRCGKNIFQALTWHVMRDNKQDK